MMTDLQKGALLRWSALGGFILGATPFFLFSLNPPSLWIVPIAPSVMSVLAVVAAKYFLDKFSPPISVWKKIGVGILLCDTYVALSIVFLGIAVGNEWWAWAVVFLVFGLLGGTLVGVLLGILAGNYFERVLRGDAPPPSGGRYWAYAAALVLAIFMGLPILSWWYSHG